MPLTSTFGYSFLMRSMICFWWNHSSCIQTLFSTSMKRMPSLSIRGRLFFAITGPTTSAHPCMSFTSSNLSSSPMSSSTRGRISPTLADDFVSTVKRTSLRISEFY